MEQSCKLLEFLGACQMGLITSSLVFPLGNGVPNYRQMLISRMITANKSSDFRIRFCIFMASVTMDLLIPDMTRESNLGQPAVPGFVFDFDWVSGKEETHVKEEE